MEHQDNLPPRSAEAEYERDDYLQREPRYRRPKLPYKSPAFTVVLSIFPGLGQIYLGYYQLGFLYAIIFASTVAALASDKIEGMEPLFGVFLGFFILFQLVDAGRKAVIYNQILERGKASDLAEDELPRPGGTLFGGVVLMVMGLLILGNTLLGMSMAWLEDWWPAGLVGVGAWLIYQSRKEQAKKP